MHQHLGGLALGGVVPVVACVEAVVQALGLKDTAREDELVLLFVRAPGDGHAPVFVVDKVPGHRQVPAEGLSEGDGPAGVPLVEQVKRVSLAKGHAVPEPGAGELIIQVLHRACLLLLLLYWICCGPRLGAVFPIIAGTKENTRAPRAWGGKYFHPGRGEAGGRMLGRGRPARWKAGPLGKMGRAGSLSPGLAAPGATP